MATKWLPNSVLSGSRAGYARKFIKRQVGLSGKSPHITKVDLNDSSPLCVARGEVISHEQNADEPT